MIVKCIGPCGLEKELNIQEFSNNNQSKTGFYSMCRICYSVRKKTYRDNQTDEQKNRDKELCKINKNNNYIRTYITYIRARSKKANLPFSLVEADIIIPDNCAILDIKIKKNTNKRADDSISIDRIDNNLGYHKNNIVIISWRANRIKNNASIKELELVYTNYFNKNQKTPENINYHLENLKIKRGSRSILSYKMTLLYEAKNRAKQNNVEFNLILNDFFIPNFCPILGIKIINGNKFRCDNSPSIDRIDNTKGYTADNIRIISFKSNRLKNDSTFEEYEKIYLFYKNLLNATPEVFT